ncbi:MAG: peptidyl-prolyl cis-trans isomerase [Elusimicrobia bacterium]|nr:peptidyl-prolyl cis-trans isomerase [Elusimicrobiota bacterium]
MKKTIFFTALLAGFTVTDIAIGPWQASAAAWAAGPKVVATVNGKAITADEVTMRLWWQHATQTLSDIMDDHLLLEEASRRKVTADEKEVDKKLEELRANYKDKAEFEHSLTAVNWSEQDLKNLIRNQITIRNTVIKAGTITVTDEDAQNYYTKNKENFITPESANLLQIFVDTKTEADDAYLALKAGADFAELASTKSTDENLKKNGGKMGFVSKGRLLPGIEKEVFALKPGEYTKPLPTGAGYSILKLEELKPRQEVSYETAKENIKASLLNQALSKEIPKLLAELRAKAKVDMAK